jgi:hypothetical protein
VRSELEINRAEQPLSQSTLELLVCIVAQGLKAISINQVAIGKALIEIRDRRLYRATHKTFEDFVKARFGWFNVQELEKIER